jgi:hypothetical protein
MNPIINKTQEFLNSLDEKSFLKYVYGILGILILTSSFLTYRYFSKTSFLKEEWRKVNKTRREAQSLLTRDALVRRQKDLVDEILKKGKSFRIMQYLDQVLNNLGLKNNKGEVRGPTISPLKNVRSQDYVEISLEVSLRNINIKQLTDFLNEIEKNDRIYSKSLEITSTKKTKTIDVKIIIGTVQLKLEPEGDKA